MSAGHPLKLVAVPPEEVPVPEAEIERPAFQTHDEAFKIGETLYRPGLYWHGYGKADQNGDAPPVDVWVCSPIHAEAVTTGEDGSNWGLFLRFRDPNRQWREWAAPLRLLKGSGEDLRGELLDMGIRIDPKNRNLLSQWMMSRYPKRRIVAASRTGWHEGKKGRCFVLPGRTIGAEDVRFQAEHASHDYFRTGGTLDGWRKEIALRCVGNPTLIFAVSVSLAGPLFKVAKLQEVGGAIIHVNGPSSKGKTTIGEVAASSWSDRASFVKTWRATANGLEAAAAALNDTLLVLDEISECDPREIGAVVYSLANGTGKQRAAKDGGARESARWRIMVLSTGERTLAGHMNEAGGKTKAGQEARFLDVPVTTRKHGAFDDLHGEPDGRAFADALKQAASTHYGHAGPAFVEELINHPQDLPARLAEISARPEFQASDGLELRSAGIFALCALAGELATEQGLTGWLEGDATAAAAEMFSLWRDRRGSPGMSTEERQILRGVRDFILRHGDSRFSPLDYGVDVTVRDRAGYWKTGDDGQRIYLLHSAALQEAAKGFDIKQIAEALDAAGWIAAKESGRHAKMTRLPDGRSARMYYVQPSEADDAA